MTVNNRDKFFEEHWDWGFLKEAGCFGDSKIEPTDIDGLIERKGNFLMMECKCPGVQINKGQDIVHIALMNTGCFSILRIWGIAKTLDIQEIQILSKRLGVQDKCHCNKDQLIKIVSQWYQFANSNPRNK